MTIEEMEEAIVQIAGGNGRGYIKAAAAALDVTPRTINNALNGKITGAFSARVRNKLDELQDRDYERNIFGAAGEWSVGHVADRQPDKNVLDEAVIMHITSPVFIMHLTMIRGADMSGEQLWEEKVRWCEEPSSDYMRAELLSEAKTRGISVITDRMQAVADRLVREKKEHTLRKAGQLSDVEIAALSPIGLSTEARVALVKGCKGDARATLHDHLADLEKQLGEASEAGHGSNYNDVRLGYLRATHRMTLVALQEIGVSEHAAHAAAVAYDMLPQADLRTERGQRAGNKDDQKKD